MKLAAHRHLYLLHPNHSARCKKCRTRYKTSGNVYVLTGKPRTSIDGTLANRILWICDGGHIRNVGWTKPVDFSMDSGKSSDTSSEEEIRLLQEDGKD